MSDITPFAVTPTTWNPADLQAITLSGGNLIASSTNNGGARSVYGAPAASGKWYFEITCTTQQQFIDACGLANSTQSLYDGGAYNHAVVVQAGAGNIYVNAAGVGSIGAGYSSGAVLGFAFDLTANLIWVRRSPSGNWNGSGTANPATAAGGLSISAVTPPLYAYIQCGSVSEVWTLNAGASAFSGAVPAGFSSGLGAGGGSGGGAAAQARAMVFA